MPSLDSLVVDLQLNSAQLKAGLKEVNEKLDELGKKAKGSHDALNTLAESKSFEIGKELVKGLFEFVEKGAQAAAVVGELAAAAGVATKPFSEMAYAANLSGVSTEDFSAALVKLDKNISLAGGGAIQQTALFRTLGVSLSDAGGHARSTEDVFNQLVDKFAGMEAGAGKTALMLETFGKAGAHLAEFMNQGTHSIAEIRAEAERLGVSLGGETAESAKKFEQALTKLKAVSTGVAMQVAGELAPSLERLANKLTSAKDSGDALHGVVVVLSTVMKVAETIAIGVGTIFQDVALKIALAASLITDAAHGDWAAAKSDIAAYSDAVSAALLHGGDDVKALWVTADDGAATATIGANAVSAAITGVGKASLKSGDDLYKSFKKGEEAGTLAKEAIKTLKEQIASMQGEVAAFGLDSFGKLEAEAESGKLSKELARAGAEGAKLKEELLAAAGQLRDMASSKLALEVDFNIKRGDIASGAANAQRQQQFGNIGKDPREILAQAEKGFGSFGDALSQLAKQTHEQASLLGDAEVLKTAGDLDGARAAELLADAAGRAAAKAGKAADAFEEDARQALVHDPFGYFGRQMVAAGGVLAGFDLSVDQASAILNSAFSKLTGQMGEVGSVMQSAAKGFEEGGFIGAIIAVIVEIVTKLKGFTDTVDSMNAYLGRMIDNLSKSTRPAFDAIVRFAEAIGTVAEAVNSLGHVFESIQLGLTIFSIVVDAIELVLLTAVKFISDALGGNKDIDKAYQKANDDLLKSGQEILDGPDHQDAVANLDDGLNKVGDTAEKVSDKFSQLLTNIPSGYKDLNAAIFGATSSGGPGSSTMGPQVGQGSAAVGSGGWWQGATGGGYGTRSNDGGSTIYSASGNSAQDDTVSQDQTSDSTRPASGSSSSSTGGSGPPPISSLMLPGMTAAEQSAWGVLFTYALGTGTCTLQQAADYANNAILGARGRSSSSSAATAGGSGGVTNIGSGGGGGIQQTAPAENHFHFHEGSILPRDFGHFVEQVSEKQRQKESQKHRNPTRTKR